MISFFLFLSGLAWDNYNLNVETLDGKKSLHVTVGIIYQNILPDESNENENLYSDARIGTTCSQLRRKFEGKIKTLVTFHRNLKSMNFKCLENSTGDPSEGENTNVKIQLISISAVDFVWLIQAFMKLSPPMFNRFYSKFVSDPLPLTRIAYSLWISFRSRPQGMMLFKKH